MLTFAAATKTTSTFPTRAPAQRRVDNFVAITCSYPSDSCDLYSDDCRSHAQLVSPSRDPIGYEDWVNQYRFGCPIDGLDPSGLQTVYGPPTPSWHPTSPKRKPYKMKWYTDPPKPKRDLRLCFTCQYDHSYPYSEIPGHRKESMDCCNKTAADATTMLTGIVNACCKDFDLLCDVAVKTKTNANPVFIPPGIKPHNQAFNATCSGLEPSIHVIVYTNQSAPGNNQGETFDGASYFWMMADCDNPGDTACHELGHCGSYKPNEGEKHPTHQPGTHCNIPHHPMNPTKYKNPPQIPVVDRNYCEALERVVGKQNATR